MRHLILLSFYILPSCLSAGGPATAITESWCLPPLNGLNPDRIATDVRSEAVSAAQYIAADAIVRTVALKKLSSSQYMKFSSSNLAPPERHLYIARAGALFPVGLTAEERRDFARRVSVLIHDTDKKEVVQLVTLTTSEAQKMAVGYPILLASERPLRSAPSTCLSGR